MTHVLRMLGLILTFCQYSIYCRLRDNYRNDSSFN